MVNKKKEGVLLTAIRICSLFERRTVGATDNYGKQNASDHPVRVWGWNRHRCPARIARANGVEIRRWFEESSNKNWTKIEQNSTRSKAIREDWKRLEEVGRESAEYWFSNKWKMISDLKKFENNFKIFSESVRILRCSTNFLVIMNESVCVRERDARSAIVRRLGGRQRCVRSGSLCVDWSGRQRCVRGELRWRIKVRKRWSADDAELNELWSPTMGDRFRCTSPDDAPAGRWTVLFKYLDK